MLPHFDQARAARAIRERSAAVEFDAADNTLQGYAGILMGSAQQELRPSRAGSRR